MRIDARQIFKRKAVSQRYRERLAGKPGLILCEEKEGVRYNYGYFPVRFVSNVFGKSRNDVADDLATRNTIARKYFYPLTSAFDAYRNMFPIQTTPVAEEVASQILTLPLYADLELCDADRICDIILEGANV